MELAGAEGKPSGLTFLSLLPFFRLPFQTWIFGRFLKFLLSLVRRDAMGHRRERERERDGGCPSVAVSTQKPSLPFRPLLFLDRGAPRHPHATPLSGLGPASFPSPKKPY